MQREAANFVFRQVWMNQRCTGLQDFCYFVTSKILFLILMVQEDRKRFVVELTELLCSYNNSLCSFNRTYFWIAVIGKDGDFLPIPSIFLDPEVTLTLISLLVGQDPSTILPFLS
jgi:hypothetical protein